MNVLYEQGLEDVAAQLTGMGFSMYPLHSRVRADAVLYVSDARAALEARPSRSGANMLCVREMSAPQIAAAIRRRSIQTLF